ncbi:MAG: tetratricopeptide repeat protein [bacterium]
MACSKIKLKPILIFFILLVVYLGSIVYRIRLGKDPEYYDPDDPTAYYWTECALQYHYAELIAQGKPISDFDPELQAPDGVRIFENLTIMMEYPCGWIYRFLKLKEKNILFHTWTILFIAGCASLSIFGIYLICRALGINEFYSLIAALLSNFSLVAVGRSTFGFLNEDFALPFILFGLGFYLYALSRPYKKFVLSIIAGLCFLISLGAWHFSRFIFLAIIIISVANLWLFEKKTKIREESALTILIILLIPLLGSLFVPVLRSRFYFLSPVFGLGLGAVIGILIFRRKIERPLFFSLSGWYSVIPALLIFALCILISRLLATETEYAHVWSLLVNKIKYLGIKPSHPEMLDYPARSLWIEAFNSPHPVSLFKDLFPVIVPAVWGFIHLLKNKWSKAYVRILLLCTVLFFLSYLAVERMGVLNNYFMVVLSVAVATTNFKNVKRFIEFILPAGLFVIFLFNFYQGYHLHQPTHYLKILRSIFGSEAPEIIYNWRLNNTELVRYIRLKTPKNSIFLSSFNVGPLILTYAARPIALQPKFEVKDCPRRVKEFFDAIYSNEEVFYTLCKRWQIDYFVYDTKLLLDDTKDGSRWIAGKVKVSSKAAAFFFHFAPEKLNHFDLIYQNTFYRIFKVLKENERPQPRLFYYHPVYDLKIYGNQSQENEFFDDRYTRNILEKVRQAKYLFQRANALLTVDPVKASALMERSIVLCPALIGSFTTLGIAYALSNRVEQGLSLCRKEVEINPLFPLAHYNLAYCLYLKGNIPGAIQEFEETLRLEPNFVPAMEMIKQLK